MSTSEAQMARRYRDHAQSLRAMAECDVHEPTRNALLSVAKNYDEMAETYDAIDRTNKKLASAASLCATKS